MTASPVSLGSATAGEPAPRAVSEPKLSGAMEMLADRVEPRTLPRCSVWAAEHVRLPASETSRPGRYDPAYLPWLSTILDLPELFPTKRGAIIRKRSQIGLSVAVMVRMLHFLIAKGGPGLFVLPKKETTREFADERFTPIAKMVPELAAALRRGSDEGRDLMDRLSFAGLGRIDFGTAGSPQDVQSRPYCNMAIDEFEASSSNFPSAGYGDLFSFAEGRVITFADVSWLDVFGHPTLDTVGICHLEREVSTQHAWVFDCPHCSATIRPGWERSVHFAEHDGYGRPIPESASFRCPACGEAITDAQRRDAVWPNSDEHPRGSARLESELSEEDQAKRMYVGVEIHGLCDPRVPLLELAREWCSKRTDQERQSFLNVKCGEGAGKAQAGITHAMLEGAVEMRDAGGLARVRLPGGERGVRLLAVGIDVQNPRENPTFYVRVNAYAAGGVVHSVAFERLGGTNSWDALAAWLASLRVAIDVPGQTGFIEPAVVGIDCGGYFLRPVADFCRRHVVGAVSGRPIRLVPVRFVGQLPGDQEFYQKGAGQRLNPARPHDPPSDIFEINRELAVDAEIGTWTGERVVVHHELTMEMQAHLISQSRRLVKQTVNFEQRERFVWHLPKGSRDDWMTAGCYATSAAILRGRLREFERLPVYPGGIGGRQAPPGTGAARASTPATGGIWNTPMDWGSR